VHVRVPAGGRGAVQGHRRRLHLADPQVPAPAIASPLAAVGSGAFASVWGAHCACSHMEQSATSCCFDSLHMLFPAFFDVSHGFGDPSFTTHPLRARENLPSATSPVLRAEPCICCAATCGARTSLPAPTRRPSRTRLTRALLLPCDLLVMFALRSAVLASMLLSTCQAGV